ncbi:unnamed protein product [Darwinula stevensoni]|uniref:Protein kinase domain-containing protein n=1 Tax=Darwinula stevensoni TaxID=69355 RepID=A0A7R8X6W1_9CRUS|nr:unnamed protein product [Darwinula stevensoni]CAG0881899.1 unnamed protein product [Darwinula stevensoni]
MCSLSGMNHRDKMIETLLRFASGNRRKRLVFANALAIVGRPTKRFRLRFEPLRGQPLGRRGALARRAKTQKGWEPETPATEVESQVLDKYQLKNRIGKGAYGVVWRGQDRSSGGAVAVKKIFDAFRNRTDAQRTFREVTFLKAFSGHPNVVSLLDVIPAENGRDLYLVFEHMDIDLSSLIKKRRHLKDVHVRYIMYQLFLAIRYIHSGNVIHRDQKPSNILLNNNCQVKVADFGLARSLAVDVDEEGNADAPLTEYVATRWYRAPEILMSCRHYTKGVDMWSLGCILGEMLNGTPLFPGTCTFSQIELILRYVPRRQGMGVRGHAYAVAVMEAASRPMRTLRDLVPYPCPDALNLLEKLLAFEPARRIDADAALRHPFVSRFHRKEPLDLAADVVPVLREDTQLSIREYREAIRNVWEADSKPFYEQDVESRPPYPDTRQPRGKTKHRENVTANYGDPVNYGEPTAHRLLPSGNHRQRSQSRAAHERREHARLVAGHDLPPSELIDSFTNVVPSHPGVQRVRVRLFDGPVPGHQVPVPGHQVPVPGHQVLVSCHPVPVPGHQAPVPGHQAPVPDNQVLVSCHPVPVPGHPDADRHQPKFFNNKVLPSAAQSNLRAYKSSKSHKYIDASGHTRENDSIFRAA